MISKLLRKPILTFSAGIFFGISLFTFYAFMNKSAIPQTGRIEKVDLTSATQLTKNYTAVAKPMNKVFRGFAVDTDQLEAMNRILKDNPGFSGFRIYIAETARGVEKRIVVGVDANGKDAISRTMYKTPVSDSGPCPSVCDSNSPL